MDISKFTKRQQEVIKYIEDSQRFKFIGCMENDDELYYNKRFTEDDNKYLRILSENENRLDEFILEILNWTEEVPSYESEKKDCEEYCREGANRSSGDIWRHAKAYKKNITIFKVMEVLFRIKHECTVQLCETIHKRVFSSDGDNDDYDWGEPDEYGLNFGEWQHISEMIK